MLKKRALAVCTLSVVLLSGCGIKVTFDNPESSAVPQIEESVPREEIVKTPTKESVPVSAKDRTEFWNAHLDDVFTHDDFLITMEEEGITLKMYLNADVANTVVSMEYEGNSLIMASLDNVFYLQDTDGIWYYTLDEESSAGQDPEEVMDSVTNMSNDVSPEQVTFVRHDDVTNEDICKGDGVTYRFDCETLLASSMTTEDDITAYFTYGVSMPSVNISNSVEVDADVLLGKLFEVLFSLAGTSYAEPDYGFNDEIIPDDSVGGSPIDYGIELPEDNYTIARKNKDTGIIYTLACRGSDRVYYITEGDDSRVAYYRDFELYVCPSLNVGDWYTVDTYDIYRLPSYAGDFLNEFMINDLTYVESTDSLDYYQGTYAYESTCACCVTKGTNVLQGLVTDEFDLAFTDCDIEMMDVETVGELPESEFVALFPRVEFY